MARSSSLFASLARARLVQFVAGGAVLFALAKRGDDAHRVIVEPSVLASLHEAEAKKLGVASLGDTHTREVDARAIEDEVLYREALQMGLDRDDPIVKQRLVQKLLLLVEDLGGASRDPSESELRAYFDADRARYAKPGNHRFVHVFARTREALPPAAALEGATEPPNAGEAFPYPRLVSSSPRAIRDLFGPDMAAAVASLGEGAISEPIRSSFGFHRVRVLAHERGAPATFEEARGEVLLDFLLARRERVVGAYLKETIARYDLRIGDTPLVGFVPTRRVAVRIERSAED